MSVANFSDRFHSILGGISHMALRFEQAQRDSGRLSVGWQRDGRFCGYVRTTLAEIAARAEAAVDTVWATAGRKPRLFRELIEAAISGADRAVPALERDYVARVHPARSRNDHAAWPGHFDNLSEKSQPNYALS